MLYWADFRRTTSVPAMWIYVEDDLSLSLKIGWWSAYLFFLSLTTGDV